MDYQLKPLGKTCAATGQPLAPGHVCHSVVLERDGRFVRMDYSDAGWKGPPANAIGYWKSRVPAPQHPHRVDPAALMRYFEQLSEESSPLQETSRFVAALLLLKLRRLKLDDVRRDDDGEFLQLSGTHGEGSFEVRHLQIPEAELAELQQHLKAQLAAEWAN
jgi:hypothetical protein